MQQEKIKEYKEKLSQKKTELAERIKRIGKEDSEGRFPTSKYATKFPDFGSHEDENAGEVETYTTNLGLEADLEQSLKDIEAALQRIEESKYGQCGRCQQEIEEARLAICPEGSLCLKCIKETKV